MVRSRKPNKKGGVSLKKTLFGNRTKSKKKKLNEKTVTSNNSVDKTEQGEDPDQAAIPETLKIGLNDEAKEQSEKKIPDRVDAGESLETASSTNQTSSASLTAEEDIPLTTKDDVPLTTKDDVPLTEKEDVPLTTKKDAPLTVDEILEDAHKQAQQGQYLRARKMYMEAQRKTHDVELKAKTWLTMGNMVLKENEDPSTSEDKRKDLKREVYDYYTIAVATIGQHGPSQVLPYIQAKLGDILRGFGDVDGALEQYSLALSHSLIIEKRLSTHILHNYAMIKYKKEEFREAQIYFEEFLTHQKYVEFGDDSSATKTSSIILSEYFDKSRKSDKYDVGEVHLILAEIYENLGTQADLDLSIVQYLSYVDLKDPKLTIRLQSENYIEGDVREELLPIVSRVGQLCFESSYCILGGNCLKEVYYAEKLKNEKDNIWMFSLLEKAYVAYTKANNTENRILMLEEIVSSEEVKDCVTDEKGGNYLETLGNLYQKANKIHSASECYIKSLEVRKQHLISNDPKLQQLQCKVSTLLYNEGKYEEALRMCENVAYISDNDVISRKALCVVGKIRAKQLDVNGCQAAFEDALELARGAGENSLERSYTFELYGQANFQLQRFSKSIDCFHQAYTTRAMNEESTTKSCLELVRDMVNVYKMMRKYRLALIACSKILASQHQIGVPAVEIASTMEIMAELHWSLGSSNDFINALELYRLSSAIRREQNGATNESLLTTYVKMAKILGLKLREQKKALELLHLVHRSYEYDENSLKPMCALRGLEAEGDIMVQKNEYSIALRKYTLVLDYIKKVLYKVDHERRQSLKEFRIDMLYKIGCAHAKLNEYDTALDYLNKGLEMKFQMNIPPLDLEHVHTSQFVYEIGLVHKEMKDKHTAIEKLSEANEILGRIPVLDKRGEVLSNEISVQLRLARRTSCICG